MPSVCFRCVVVVVVSAENRCIPTQTFTHSHGWSSQPKESEKDCDARAKHWRTHKHTHAHCETSRRFVACYALHCDVHGLYIRTKTVMYVHAITCCMWARTIYYIRCEPICVAHVEPLPFVRDDLPVFAMCWRTEKGDVVRLVARETVAMPDQVRQ